MVIVKGLFNQFIRFSAVGVVGTTFHYLILIGLVQIIRVDAVAASIAGFTAGAFVNYFLNYHVTFRSSKCHKETILKFFSIALVGLLINSSMMAVAVKYFKVNYLFAQIFATGSVLICTFMGNRFWTFHEKGKVGIE
jgi:putative flippase GtrA